MTQSQNARLPEGSIHPSLTDALVTAWRMGECSLVKQTLNATRDDKLKTAWRDTVMKQLLPGEREGFDKYTRGI